MPNTVWTLDTSIYMYLDLSHGSLIKCLSGCVPPGEVYAIGGYNGVKTVNVVEKYNPEEAAWKEVAPLVFSRSVPGIAVAHLHNCI